MELSILFWGECSGKVLREWRKILGEDQIGLGSLLMRFSHSVLGSFELRRISAISPSGVKPGDSSTAAHRTAPNGRIVS